MSAKAGEGQDYAPTPVVALHAEYVLPAGRGGDADAVVAVRASAADGGTLAAVTVDLEPLGSAPGEVALSLEQDDLWTVPADVVPSAEGEYQLSVFAEDAAGNTHCGLLNIEVADVGGSFVDASAMTGALVSVVGEPTAVAPVDYNADGLDDFAAGFGDGAGQLLKTDYSSSGVPHSIDRTEDVFGLQTVATGADGVLSADIDNDGFEDLLVCHSTAPMLFVNEANGADRKYVNETSTRFNSTALYNAIPDQIYSATWGDYNGDGWIDLAIIGHIDGTPPPGYPGGKAALILYKNVAGVFHFTNAAVATVVGDEFVGEVPQTYVTWIDLTDHGARDLLFSSVESAGSGPRVFKNLGYSGALGDRAFEDQTSVWFPGGAGPDSVVAVRTIDFDHDNYQDIVMARDASSDNLQIFRHGSAPDSFVRVETQQWSIGPFREGLRDVAIWDYDHNGTEDIVVVPASDNARPRLLLGGLRGAGNYSETVEPGLYPGDYRRAMTAEWGGGRPALYAARATTESQNQDFMYSYVPNAGGQGNAYTRFRIGDSGTVNGVGIGTLLTIVYINSDNVITARRWVDGGSGRGSQQTRDIEFGLGDYSGSEVYLFVTWPDSTIQAILDAPVTSITSADEVFTINKTTNPLAFENHIFNKQSVPVSAVFKLGPVDDNAWVFTWDMNSQAKCYIEFEHNNDPAGCSCMGDGIIAPGDPDVDYDVTQIGDHVFRHTLTWGGRCCYQNCSFVYRVFGALGGPEVPSGDLTCHTGPICTSNY